MQKSTLGKTGRDIGVVGQGCWQFGGDWGDVGDDAAMAVLHTAADEGVTFFDTADVYGDGHSEELVGRFLKERTDDSIMVATKFGRRADPHVPESFTRENLRAWNDRSRALLGLDTIDLVQLHCPPTPVYSDDRVFDVLDEMVEEGRIRNYGVSVETVDEAMTALTRPGVASIQIILNVFRRKPLEKVLPAAMEAGVGIIARVPLASGLLTGRFTESTTFAPQDHRTYNRHGESFDQGETFSGVPYDVGVAAAREFVSLVPQGVTPAQFALRWIIDQPGVSVVIPGASRPDQAKANAAAGSLLPLTREQLDACERIYDEYIRSHVHDRW
ncbi:aldo/keto reductase [Tessaracoccus sp. ZS01]|uniref:aldo/keto reductase n=1 Tax=Tessaracoccus sp. ZS01 TaxID=1906324 RepID=UPI00096E0787|nr:aldo/keto reductase [Tessaracoccus sp. ZS01]MCG6568513.1 aldo/keto reductase [Tessaracoccus sp. ZS01]OMG52692.1 aldo/keto reductase [Tessaracoccus sp. ZS01]